MTWENRLKFYVSSADPDSASPVWVDLSSRVMDNVQPLDQTNGRTNVLDDITTPGQPGQLTLVLDNRDGALTYGNTTSPYASWWGPGRKCLLTETISGVAQNRFTGYLQMPTEAVMTDGMESRVAISAIDRLGRLSQGRPFVSTLGAHIMGSVRNSALDTYLPLVESGTDTFPLAVSPAVGAGSVIADLEGRTSGDNIQKAQWQAQTGASLPGDDVATLLATIGIGDGRGSPTLVISPVVRVVYLAQNVLTSGKAATGVIWYRPEPQTISVSSASIFVVDALTNLTGSGQLSIGTVSDSSGQHWQLNLTTTAITGTINAPDGSANATDRWYMLGCRVGFGPNVFELWVDGNVYTGAMSGTPTSISVFGLSSSPLGAVAHAQIYAGAQADFTNADFLAQRQVGLTGLEGQTTGARVDSILGYAGVPASDYSSTDAGTSVMQIARLAGKDPLTALREAETTEQGTLYVDGSGSIHFADRRTLYGI